MTEIRPIRAQEAEPFLTLLCDVFGLDYDRAHRVFFAEPMFDLGRKWALFEGGRMVSILTTVPLLFGWGKAIGIAGVATLDECRGRGLASSLLHAAIAHAERQGERAAFLFARQPHLYERAGFQVLDEVWRARLKTVPEEGLPDVLDFPEVTARYDRWAVEDPNRLRRDERRWGYWRWNLRVCTLFGDGYLCHEAGVVRECVVSSPVAEWPLPSGAEWFGLASVAERIEAPLDSPERELLLMGRAAPGRPQMFMTDQF